MWVYVCLNCIHPCWITKPIRKVKKDLSFTKEMLLASSYALGKVRSILYCFDIFFSIFLWPIPAMS